MNVLLSLFFALIVGIQYASAAETIHMAADASFYTGSCIPFYLTDYTIATSITVQLYYSTSVGGSPINFIQVSANLTPYCIPIPFNLTLDGTKHFFLHTNIPYTDAGTGSQTAVLKSNVVEPFSKATAQYDFIQGNQIIPIAIAVTNSTNPSTAYYLFATSLSPGDYSLASPVSLNFFENYSAYFGLTQGLIPNVTFTTYFVTFAEGNTVSEITLGYSTFGNVPQPLIQTTYIPRALF
mgnify:CR=1 FL=1